MTTSSLCQRRMQPQSFFTLRFSLCRYTALVKNIFSLSAFIIFLMAPHLFAADNRIPTDVVNAGGGEGAKSNLYLLNDSLGEPIVGQGRTANYLLESGYRKPSASEFLSMVCDSTASLGVLNIGAQQTTEATCTVYTDASSGYALKWSVPTGSGGVNTGSLISQYNAAFPPYAPAVADVPETWSVPVANAEWGGRLKSESTDTAVEWGTDNSTDKWLNVQKLTTRTIVTRSTATPLNGSEEVLQFRAELGSSAVQAEGIYRTTVVLTVLSY